MLGRETVVLVNENLKAGSYAVEWDAENYPSGFYLYTIMADGNRETKKMILGK